MVAKPEKTYLHSRMFQANVTQVASKLAREAAKKAGTSPGPASLSDTFVKGDLKITVIVGLKVEKV